MLSDLTNTNEQMIHKARGPIANFSDPFGFVFSLFVSATLNLKIPRPDLFNPRADKVPLNRRGATSGRCGSLHSP